MNEKNEETSRAGKTDWAANNLTLNIFLMLWIVEGSCMNSSDIWKRHGASSMLGLILKSMAVSKLRTIAKTIWKRKKVFNKDMSKTSIGTYLEICTSAIHTLCIFELLEFISHIIFLSADDLPLLTLLIITYLLVLTRHRRHVRAKIGRAHLEKGSLFCPNLKLCTIGQPTTYVAKREKHSSWVTIAFALS